MLLLRVLTAGACQGQPDRGVDCPTTYGSAGALFSFAFGARGSFGIGTEFSATHLPNNLSIAGWGGFLNGVYYFTGSRYFRVTAGGQASYVVGAEAGAAFLSRSSAETDIPATAGATLGAFTAWPTPFLPLVRVALRATLPFEGPVHYSVDIGLNVPFVLQGPGYRFD